MAHTNRCIRSEDEWRCSGDCTHDKDEEASKNVRLLAAIAMEAAGAQLAADLEIANHPRVKEVREMRFHMLSARLLLREALGCVCTCPNCDKGVHLVCSLCRGQHRTWEDAPLPEDEAIKAAHPTRGGRHDLYMEAMRLVGARHSKGSLVELVNWLLVNEAHKSVLLTEAMIKLNRDRAQEAAPIPMLLYCPKCHHRHIDVEEFATKPHHTHACQWPGCGHVWRPAIVPTVGVEFLPGFKNDQDPEPARLIRRILLAASSAQSLEAAEFKDALWDAKTWLHRSST